MVSSMPTITGSSGATHAATNTRNRILLSCRLVLQAHPPRRAAHCALTGRHNRSDQQQEGVFPDARAEQMGKRVQNRYNLAWQGQHLSTSLGRGGERRGPCLFYFVESYPPNG